ncbi:MAG TPA: ATP-binding protein, partial [Jatrophihabitans sp.]|nr:ATP-binding protein [Jatrophihabitans sp.]
MTEGPAPAGSGVPETDSPYEMSISLNVLNHLGLNLYSNHPAVLSEAVANAWDADAHSVTITLDLDSETVVVHDDGCGMTLEDINNRFLRVGYQRRNDPATSVTPSGRQVMGRKGIGKLSLFSIAGKVKVETARDGQKNALLMDLEAIKVAISNTDPSTAGPYKPKPLDTSAINFSHGTRITLTALKRSITRTESFL